MGQARKWTCTTGRAFRKSNEGKTCVERLRQCPNISASAEPVVPNQCPVRLHFHHERPAPNVVNGPVFRQAGRRQARQCNPEHDPLHHIRSASADPSAMFTRAQRIAGSAFGTFPWDRRSGWAIRAALRLKLVLSTRPGNCQYSRPTGGRTAVQQAVVESGRCLVSRKRRHTRKGIA